MRHFACFLLLSTFAWAQGLHCPDPRSKVACDSFNELLTKGDSTLLESASEDFAVACFRSTKDDYFFTISWFGPSDLLWHATIRQPDGSTKDGFLDLGRIDPNTLTGILVQDAVLGIGMYTSGVRSQTLVFLGHWQGRLQGKRVTLVQPEFLALREKQIVAGDATVTASEIDAAYDFTNLSNTTTHYHLIVQRATGRFQETYDADTEHSMQSGRCESFRKSTKTPKATPQKNVK